VLREIRIISSNIRFASDEDGPNTWHKRKGFLSNLLNEADPDILCSQEGRKPQILEFESFLKNLHLIDEHRDWLTERMYPCIYLNLKKFQVERSGDFWLSSTPNVAGSKSFDSAFPRLCSWVMAEDKATKKKFYIFNTHLDHLKGETRYQQAKVLHENIQLINKDNLPYLLCGDFNEGPSEKVHDLLTSEHLTDPWIDLKISEETSFNKFQKNFQQGKRIDWILVSSDIKTSHIYLDKRDKEPLFPSDHFPVIAHFSIKDS